MIKLVLVTLYFLAINCYQGHGTNNLNKKPSELISDESRLRAKFRELYAEDTDVPHSVGFLQSDCQVCYKDENNLRRRINRDELQKDVLPGGKCSKMLYDKDCKY